MYAWIWTTGGSCRVAGLFLFRQILGLVARANKKSDKKRIYFGCFSDALGGQPAANKWRDHMVNLESHALRTPLVDEVGKQGILTLDHVRACKRATRRAALAKAAEKEQKMKDTHTHI